MFLPSKEVSLRIYKDPSYLSSPPPFRPVTFVSQIRGLTRKRISAFTPLLARDKIVNSHFGRGVWLV
jgi:hypothetical protein